MISLDGNLTLSSNKILNYTQYLDLFDDNWNFISQQVRNYDKTDISFSPALTGMAMITLRPAEGLYLSVNGKYVGKQYLDNTSDNSKSVPSYFIAGASALKSFELKKGRFIDVQLFADNIFNKKYFSNGWIYSAMFLNGTPYVEEGLYPQAEINFTLKVSLRF